MRKELEQALLPALANLPQPLQLMLICGISERLRPALQFDSTDFGRETAMIAERVLDTLWSSITSAAAIEEIDDYCEDIDTRNMDDDEGEWYCERAFIAEACAAVTYAAFFARDGDIKNILYALNCELLCYEYMEQQADGSDHLRALNAKMRSLGDAVPALVERTMSDIIHAEHVLRSFDRAGAVMKFRLRSMSFGHWLWR